MKGTLCIHELLTTNTRRCINQVIVLFSLNHQLNIVINGKYESANTDVIIINHNDLFQIKYATALVELALPIQQFNTVHQSFFNNYYNFKQLTSIDTIKHHILTMIEQLHNQYEVDDQTLSKLIEILNRETKIHLDTLYIPSILSENTLLNNITEFIKTHSNYPITSKEITNVFYISTSYISILFKKYLGIHFKHYVASLKIALSLDELMYTQNTIHRISEHVGFNHYSIYTHHFKQYLNITPNMYRKNCTRNNAIPIKLITADIANYASYFKSIEIDHPTKDNQINIDLDDLCYNTLTKVPKVFIHIDHITDMIQANINSKMKFIDFAEIYLLLNNLNNLALEKSSLTTVITFLNSVFSNQLHLAVRIETINHFISIENMILQISNSTLAFEIQNKMDNLLLLFDAQQLSLKDIKRFSSKIRNINTQIKLAITVEGVINQSSSLTLALKQLHHFNFDFNFIDIETSNTRSSLYALHKDFKKEMSYFECYNKLIEISHIPSTKFVYTKLTKNCFKYYESNIPLRLSDLMCHMMVMLTSGCGVGYSLINKNETELAIMNRFCIYEPLIYLYQFIKPFIGKRLYMHQNYIVFKDESNIHVLLFNALHQHLTTNHSQTFVLKHYDLSNQSLVFIQTLNKEHGLIDYVLPPSFDNTYIERSILQHIEQSSQPKAEIKQLTTLNDSLTFKIAQDELKYIRISPQ
ncbi:AraC family transcriptional regulator [Staphylococcus succinus]|nr:AraC family transcriptional regulator [Staphylococcus succinus]